MIYREPANTASQPVIRHSWYMLVKRMFQRAQVAKAKPLRRPTCWACQRKFPADRKGIQAPQCSEEEICVGRILMRRAKTRDRYDDLVKLYTNNFIIRIPSDLIPPPSDCDFAREKQKKRKKA